MSLVLLAGSRALGPLIGFIERELAITTAWWIGSLAAEKSDTLNYTDTRANLASLGASLVRGQLASVQMRRRPLPLLVGLYQPKFCDARLSLWTCIIEGGREEVMDLYDKIKLDDGIAFAVISLDEAPDLACEEVSVETFPWQDWHIVRAWVRSSGGELTERAGPAA